MTAVLSIIIALAAYLPGQIVPDSAIGSAGVETFFYKSEIPDNLFSLMEGKSYKKECTVPRDSLKYLRCLHRDAEGHAVVGEMVVANAIADRVLKILKQLFLASYPIEKMRLVDYWDADDEKSMSANNSSSFNFRFISNTKRISRHGLGLAVDINPLYNPYVKTLSDGTTSVEPAEGKKFLDRKGSHPYMIKADDLCCRLFKENGFSWGGDWKSSKDYQHFEYR